MPPKIFVNLSKRATGFEPLTGWILYDRAAEDRVFQLQGAPGPGGLFIVIVEHHGDDCGYDAPIAPLHLAGPVRIDPCIRGASTRSALFYACCLRRCAGIGSSSARIMMPTGPAVACNNRAACGKSLAATEGRVPTAIRAVLLEARHPVSQGREADLREIWQTGTRVAAEAALDVFVEKHGAEYHKTATCLTKDREALLAFYDVLADYWSYG